MSEAKEAKEVKGAKELYKAIDNEIVEMANQLAAGLTIGSDGTGKVDPTVSRAVLERAGVSGETYKVVFNGLKKFTAAAALASGDAGIEHMKGNKDTGRVVVDVPMYSHDSVTCAIARSRDVLVRPGEKDTTTIYGPSTVALQVAATRRSGNVGDVKRYLQAQAAEMLKG